MRALSVGDMRDYYRRFYHPGNATLVVCGDVSPAEAERAARKRFGALPSGPEYAEADCFRGPVETLPGLVRLTTRWDDSGKRLCMAWQTVPVATSDDDALDLILAALIIQGWPSTATWALGLIVGVNLVTSGAAIIMVALAGRSVVKALASAVR